MKKHLASLLALLTIVTCVPSLQAQMPTDKEQKLTFQCGMAMYKSSVVVN